MPRIFITTALVAIISFWGKAQTLDDVLDQDRKGKSMRVVFYNVENLFDTIADANIQDEEFLPTSEKEWNTIKYRTKIANLAKTIRAVGGWQAPEIVGFAEIENRSVLLDLCAHGVFSGTNYGIVHYDSDDPRGIDVGLCYNTDLMEVLYSEPIKMRAENVRTRDILYAKFLVNAQDTIHVFVNHWPSRRGGQAASEHKRLFAAERLKSKTDSILMQDEQAAIVVMGDFNDAPIDASLQYISAAETYPLNNLMANLPVTEGSHKYRGVWDYLDQILVSPSLVQGQNLQLYLPRAFVFNQSFLLVNDDKYGDYYPARSWKGNFFVGGYSDHLPVFIDILFN